MDEQTYDQKIATLKAYIQNVFGPDAFPDAINNNEVDIDEIIGLTTSYDDDFKAVTEHLKDAEKWTVEPYNYNMQGVWVNADFKGFHVTMYFLETENRFVDDLITHYVEKMDGDGLVELLSFIREKDYSHDFFINIDLEE